MSSEQPTYEMAALRKKILSLEVKMKMQRMKRDNREAWEKRDREAATENERRDRLLENERKDRHTQKKELEQAHENERRDRLLENERRDRKDLEQKMELIKMQTAHALENEKRDRMLENEKRDRMLENEKRDRMLENEKRDRDARRLWISGGRSRHFRFARKSVSDLKSSSFPGLISIQNLPKSVLFPDISEFFG
jgi:hypothetical protein